MTRVLLDFHHEQLYIGLQRLLEGRFGFEVFRPIGLEWAHENFWAVYRGPRWEDTAGQFLGLHLGKEWDEIRSRFPPDAYIAFLNRGAEEKEDGVYLIPDTQRNLVYRGITLEKFKKTQFDVIISSMPDHTEPFNRLQKQFQPNAKRIAQVGNNWGSFPTVPNLMSSARLCRPATGQNFCFYHQEFDLELFKPTTCPNPRSVMNMSHIMGDSAHFFQLEKMMPDWTWHAYGAGNRDKPVDTDKIPQAFQDHGFVIHLKPQGDGFGFNMFQAFACGRPLIIKGHHFRGMTAEALFEDGKTVIDLDKHSNEEAVKMLRAAADDYQTWSDRVYARFKEVVNYEREFEEVLKPFFERLK